MGNFVSETDGRSYGAGSKFRNVRLLPADRYGLVDWRISVLIDITISGLTMPYCPTACGGKVVPQAPKGEGCEAALLPTGIYRLMCHYQFLPRFFARGQNDDGAGRKAYNAV